MISRDLFSKEFKGIEIRFEIFLNFHVQHKWEITLYYKGSMTD